MKGQGNQEGGRKGLSGSLEVSVDDVIGYGFWDSDHQEWLKWLAPAWNPNPKPDDLKEVKKEYRAIDIKMSLAMTGMLKTAGDPARTVRIEVEKLQRHRAKHSKIMSRSDLPLSDQLPNSDVRKPYDLLMSFNVKRSKLDKEKKNLAEKEKAWIEITNPKPGAPATKAEKEKAKKEKEKQEKEKKEKEKKEKEKKEKDKKEKEKKEKERKEKEKKEKEQQGDKPGVLVVLDAKAKSHPHPKGKGKGGRSSSPKDGKRPCYCYLVKRDSRNGNC